MTTLLTIIAIALTLTTGALVAWTIHAAYREDTEQ